MADLSSQRSEILYQFVLSMVGSIFFFMISWITLDADDQGSGIWWTGIFLLTLSLLHCLFRMIMVDKLTRAYQYHLSMLVQCVLMSLIFLDAAIRTMAFSVNLSSFQQILLISISLLLACFGLFTGAQIEGEKLREAYQHNLDSGRLELSNRKWNLEKPLRMDAPKKENQRIKRINNLAKLSPLVTATSFAVAKKVEGKSQLLLIGLCVYGLFFVLAWGGSRHLALTIQLRKWENEQGIEITL